MKVKVSVAVEKELLEWAQGQVRLMKFRNVSHVFDYALMRLKEDAEKRPG